MKKQSETGQKQKATGQIAETNTVRKVADEEEKLGNQEKEKGLDLAEKSQ